MGYVAMCCAANIMRIGPLGVLMYLCARIHINESIYQLNVQPK